MNIPAAKAAIKGLIDDNKATFVNGLTAQGIARSIAQITTSPLTPPQAYYFVVIECSSANAANAIAQANMQFPPRRYIYSIQLGVTDYAVGQTGEDQLYEAMSDDFGLLISRMVNLLETTALITDADSGLTFRLLRSGQANRLIQVDSLPMTWADAEGYHSMLLAQLSFQLEEC